MLSARSLAVGVSTLGSGGSHGHVGYAVDIAKVKLYPDKKGTVADLQPMSKFCGTKPIKVALSDGWGGNYWRHITRAEFEDEASKCKNITDDPLHRRRVQAGETDCRHRGPDRAEV